MKPTENCWYQNLKCQKLTIYDRHGIGTNDNLEKLGKNLIVKKILKNNKTDRKLMVPKVFMSILWQKYLNHEK